MNSIGFIDMGSLTFNGERVYHPFSIFSLLSYVVAVVLTREGVDPDDISYS